MRPGRVFCFDLDDTLISEEDYVESGLAAAGKLVDALAPGSETAGEYLVRLWREERSSEGFQRLLRERNLEPEYWLPRLRQAYRDHVPVLCPRPGVIELLQAIVAGGGELALVSDGWLTVQRGKWSVLALPFLFDPVIFTDERGRDFWKPHPWGFEQVMAAHPTAACFYYVGDNPAKDFIAPNRLGWTTVLVRNTKNLHPSTFSQEDVAAPKLVVDSLHELSRLA